MLLAAIGYDGLSRDHCLQTAANQEETTFGQLQLDNLIKPHESSSNGFLIIAL